VKKVIPLLFTLGTIAKQSSLNKFDTLYLAGKTKKLAGNEFLLAVKEGNSGLVKYMPLLFILSRLFLFLGLKNGTQILMFATDFLRGF
jgi:hypothetical protein